MVEIIFEREKKYAVVGNFAQLLIEINQTKIGQKLTFQLSGQLSDAQRAKLKKIVVIEKSTYHSNVDITHIEVSKITIEDLKNYRTLGKN